MENSFLPSRFVSGNTRLGTVRSWRTTTLPSRSLRRYDPYQVRRVVSKHTVQKLSAHKGTPASSSSIAFSKKRSTPVVIVCENAVCTSRGAVLLCVCCCSVSCEHKTSFLWLRDFLQSAVIRLPISRIGSRGPIPTSCLETVSLPTACLPMMSRTRKLPVRGEYSI